MVQIIGGISDTDAKLFECFRHIFCQECGLLVILLAAGGISQLTPGRQAHLLTTLSNLQCICHDGGQEALAGKTYEPHPAGQTMWEAEPDLLHSGSTPVNTHPPYLEQQRWNKKDNGTQQLMQAIASVFDRHCGGRWLPLTAVRHCRHHHCASCNAEQALQAPGADDTGSIELPSQ
eukprot:GHUV01029333.1.p1 GENE.GHUV01029333.1~~GHUV01029333.1.p1  ORF type:complete len:176 (-),score=18.63 GHUV01029333.1:284-811(-)